MPVKEFWEDDPKLLWAYRSSYMDKVQIQSEINNYNAWLNGFYVYDAISACLSGLGRGKARTYMRKPYDFSKTAEEQEIEERENSIKEQLKRGKRALSKGEDR